MRLFFAIAVFTVCAFAQSAGSLYSPAHRLSDPVRDLRASQLGDIVTIVVSDRASAVVKGTSVSARKSAAKASVGALPGLPSGSKVLNNLASIGGDQSLQGQGQTTRENTLQTTLSARVINVAPNGDLVIEASKSVSINSENQWVYVKGIVRPVDLSTGNTIASDRIANLELRVNGKGLVGDSVKRPFILYRVLLGLLPF
jgi:flagellar L-ring protein precursor FlgH